MLHTPALMRALYALVRPFLSDKLTKGLRFERSGADPLRTATPSWSNKSLPTAWGGTRFADLFYETVLERLQERHEHEKTFRLAS